MLQRVTLRVVERLAEVPQKQWDDLLDAAANPFVSWTFLQTLEETGCVAPERGWWPCHLTAWEGEELVGAAPAYLKADSAGDFSRDWGFAELVARSGVRYYPKMVVGVPFSPVTGRRFLVRAGYDRTSMVGMLVHLARELARENDVSSVHVLYHQGDETADLEGAGMSGRVLVQYHWHNRGYRDLDDWLAALRSKKRTQIRRERREPVRQGITLHTVRDEELRRDPERWAKEAFELYRRNTQKHFWGGQYLNQSFYQRICERMAHCVELVTARRDGRVVAAAFNLATPSHLYGRYWGCHEEHRFLHFNVALYHSIEECIARGIGVFEGGAGGEHKLSRGFDPTAVRTAHLFLDREVDDLLGRYLRAESRARLEQLEASR